MSLRGLLHPLVARERSARANSHLGIILAFVAGAVNAGGFVAVGRYTSHMTGIVSSIGNSLALHETSATLYAVGFILAFMGGAATCSFIVNHARQHHWHSEFASALMLEAILLLIFGLSASGFLPGLTFSLNFTIALLCYLMGLQNAVISKISHSVIRTTHVTGISTDIGIELGRYLFRFLKGADIPVHYERIHILLSLLLSFLSGSILGALSFPTIGFATVIPLALLLIAIAIEPVLLDLRLLRREQP